MINGRAGLWLRDSEGRWSRVVLRLQADGAIRPAPPLTNLSQGVLPGGEVYFFVTAMLLFLLFGGMGAMVLKAETSRPLSRWAGVFAVATIAAWPARCSCCSGVRPPILQRLLASAA